MEGRTNIKNYKRKVPFQPYFLVICENIIQIHFEKVAKYPLTMARKQKIIEK